MSLINKLTSNSNSLQNILGTLNSINIEAKHQSNLISQIKARLQNDSTDGDSSNINLQSKTVTPTASDQMVICDSEYDALSSVTVNGDANLKAENIISGATIFGVEGRAGVGASEGLKWWEEGEVVGDAKTCNITFNTEDGWYCYPETLIYKQISSSSTGQLLASFTCEFETSRDDIGIYSTPLTNVATNSLMIVKLSVHGNYFQMSEDPQIIKIYEDIDYNNSYGIFIFYVSPNATTITIYMSSGDEY